MRPFIAFILVFFNLPLAEAQINLVANPSIKNTIFYPLGIDNTQVVLGCSSFRNNAEYFNGCSVTKLSNQLTK